MQSKGIIICRPSPIQVLFADIVPCLTRSDVWEQDPSLLSLLRADTGRNEVKSVCDLILFQLREPADMLIHVAWMENQVLRTAS
jgi:hypothetical protein